VTLSSAELESLFPSGRGYEGVDRKVLAGLLVELARSFDEKVDARTTGIEPLDPRLEQLRRLVLGQEIETLSRLTQQFDDPEQLAPVVGRVLPAAVEVAWAQDRKLGEVLAPAFEEATRSSIRSDPRILINILHPLMMPAIGRSISDTIDALFQSLNETLKHSLSWRGLAWRWEAWRTGTSFAEVVLKHTLVYQVEHVFLIHRHTGLLIAHVAAPDASSQDPQLVSSMLVAIQDFVRDSFTGAEQQGLDALRLGELRLWSEPGPFATLVAVIRGNPPESLHETFGRAISRINADFHEALKDFNGDSSPFSDVESVLNECAQLRQRADHSAANRPRWYVASIALGLLALVGIFAFGRWSEARRWDDYVNRLRGQPGIVVTEAGRQDGKWSVSGLRDPLAADPQAVLRQTAIDPARVVGHWQAYQSLDPAFVLRRLSDTLRPPPALRFAVEGERIVAHGSASAGWLQRARATAAALPAGSPAVDFTRVRDLNNGVLDKLTRAIQAHEIFFDNKGPVPPRSQDAILDEVAQELHDLAALSSTLGVTARVMVTGHADATGSEMFNLSLSQARAEAVRVLLKKRGIDPKLLAVRAAGPFEPAETANSNAARSHNRRVSFTVEIDQ
jgi:OOP family OmpA-OmpF porin